MTAREMIAVLGAHPQPLLLALLMAPGLAILLGFLHGKHEGHKTPWCFIYSVLVYFGTVPGVFSATICLYTLFFTHENLLDTNPLVYIAPILVMVVTLGVVRRRVSFADLPGVDRLAGFVLLLTITNFAVIALHRTSIMVVFHGGLWTMLLIGAAVFVGCKVGMAMLFGRPAPRERY